MPAVNWLLEQQDLPLHLEQRRDLLLYVYEPVVGGLRLQALDYDSVYLNLIAVAALFTATSGVNWGWRVRWIACSWLFLWATHVISFLLGGQVAVSGYLATLTPTEASVTPAIQLNAAFSALDPAVGSPARVVERLGSLRAWTRGVVPRHPQSIHRRPEGANCRVGDSLPG